MHIFDYKKYKEHTWDNEIISYVSQIHEYRGKQNYNGRKTHYVSADAYE